MITNVISNEKNKKLELENTLNDYTRYKVDITNKNDVKIYGINETGLNPLLRDETLSLITNEKNKFGIGVGKELENHPYKKFENEIWFNFKNGNRNGFENGIRNENGNENRNENRNENEKEMNTRNEQAINNIRKLRTLI